MYIGWTQNQKIGRSEMACRSVLKTVFLTEPWRPFPRNRSPFPFPFTTNKPSTTPTLLRYHRKITRVRDYHFARQTQSLNCSHNENPSSSSSSSSSEEEEDPDQGPPQEAILKAISEVSKTEGRVGQTTNVVIGGTVTDDSTNEWLTLDQKVNSYPTVRGFTAIGTGGDDFVQAMVVAVESVLQHPIPEGQVKQKVSSGGKYVSVNIGPVQVISSEQVQAVYNAMRRDDRMKYFL